MLFKAGVRLAISGRRTSEQQCGQSQVGEGEREQVSMLFKA